MILSLPALTWRDTSWEQSLRGMSSSADKTAQVPRRHTDKTIVSLLSTSLVLVYYLLVLTFSGGKQVSAL